MPDVTKEELEELELVGKSAFEIAVEVAKAASPVRQAEVKGQQVDPLFGDARHGGVS